MIRDMDYVYAPISASRCGWVLKSFNRKQGLYAEVCGVPVDDTWEKCQHLAPPSEAATVNRLRSFGYITKRLAERLVQRVLRSFLTDSLHDPKWSRNGRLYEHVPKAKTVIEVLMVTIIDVGDNNQLIRCVLEYRLRWSDPRLAWNPYIAENAMETNPVAAPDTFTDNVVISSNGDILRVFTLSTLLTSTIQAGKFPFDIQHCSLDFAEYLMDPSETNLFMHVPEDAIFKGNGEWCIKNITSSMKLIDYGVEPYHTVSLKFDMQRLSPYYLTLMYPFKLSPIFPCSHCFGFPMLG
ncbi:hypothetical protein RB195_002150 [Necator americanus]|uniref:Neurotransmitter-gated ion-channel ligand-binding domain-containing protein n=1 Tax=Necator americanus TaxID=51031 RepID=A0ABR1DJ15_NECAM